jgi:hypothetical protein
MMADITGNRGPTFVPVMVDLGVEEERPTVGSIKIEFGGGLMMRVPGDIPDHRVMALVRALRRPGTGADRTERVEARLFIRVHGDLQIETRRPVEDHGM